MSYTNEEIRKMQSFINSPDWPLPYNKWPNPREVKNNCLAYALGLPIDDPCGHLFGHMESYDQFESLLNQLNLSFRKIDNENDLKDDEYGIIFYMIPCRDKDFGFLKTDQHFVRIELDRSWTYKAGCRLFPMPTLKENLKEFSEFQIYAIRKPQ